MSKGTPIRIPVQSDPVDASTGTSKIIASAPDRRPIEPVREPSKQFGEVFDRIRPEFPTTIRRTGTDPVTILEVHQGTHEKTVPPVQDIVFRLVSDGPIERSEVDYGDGIRPLSGQRGSFYVAPAGAEAVWRAEGEHRLLMLALPEQRVLDLVGDENGKTGADPFRSLYGRDLANPALSVLLRNIWTQSQQTGRANALMIDGFVMAMLGNLLHMSEDGRSQRPSVPEVPLDDARLARVRDYVENNYGKALSVGELAEIACLSKAHFARAFKLATSMTPHAYVTERRVAIAREKLLRTDLGLAEIALSCGFANQSHFSTVFRSKTGTTPAAFRQSVI